MPHAQPTEAGQTTANIAYNNARNAQIPCTSFAFSNNGLMFSRVIDNSISGTACGSSSGYGGALWTGPVLLLPGAAPLGGGRCGLVQGSDIRFFALVSVNSLTDLTNDTRRAARNRNGGNAQAFPTK